MKKMCLILVCCILMSTMCFPVLSEEGSNIIYYNDFTEPLQAGGPLTLSPVKNTSQDSILVQEDEGVLLYRGSGSTNWTSSTSHAKLRLGTIAKKPPLVYEIKFKTSLFASSATMNHRTSEGESPLFYLKSNGGELYDKLNGTLITTIDDLEEWHTITILFDNQADSDGKYYRTICLDGKTFEKSRVEGNEYAKSGIFSVSPTASLQTLTDGRDREVRYDYIKVYACPEEFSADMKLNEARDQIDLSFSFLPDTNTLRKENFILSDGAKNTSIRSIDQISLTDYRLSLEEPLSFDTDYTLTLSNILDVQGKAIAEPLCFHTRKAKYTVENIFLSQGNYIQDGTMTAQLSVLNETEQDIAAKLIIAKFNEENLMYAHEIKDFSMQKDRQENISLDFGLDASAKNIQLFVLKNSEEFESLSGAYNFSRSDEPKSEELLVSNSDIKEPSFSYQISEETGTVALKINCDEEPRTVTAGLKKGDSLAYIGQSNTNGQTAQFTFALNEEGVYDLFYGVSGSSEICDLKDAVTYYKAETIQKAFEAVNNTEDIAIVSDFFKEFGNTVELDLDAYNTFSSEEQDMILQSIIQQRKEFPEQKFESIDDLKAALTTAAKLMSVYKKQTTVTESLMDILSEDDLTFYQKQLTQRIQNMVSEKCSDAWYATPSEMEKAFREALILEGIKSGDNYSLTTAIIEKYAKVIPLDMSDYNKLKNAYEVCRQISGKEYTDFSALQKAFEKAVAAQKKKEAGTQTSTRPSSGSQSSGMSFYPPSATPTPTSSPTIPPKKEMPFQDMETSTWAQEAVKTLWEKGIVQGKSDDIFAPEDSITRAELAKILVTAFEIEGEAEECIFTDVQSSDWYYSYILRAFENQLIKGIDESHFGPDEEVTREMAATMIYRVCQLKNISLKEAEKTFTDDNVISEYAKEAVRILGGNEVINGYEDGSFGPKKSCTRAEISKLIYELIW